MLANGNADQSVDQRFTLCDIPAQRVVRLKSVDGFVELAVGDFDNDGRPDIYVSSYVDTPLKEHDFLYHNGGGRFSDVTFVYPDGTPALEGVSVTIATASSVTAADAKGIHPSAAASIRTVLARPDVSCTAERVRRNDPLNASTNWNHRCTNKTPAMVTPRVSSAVAVADGSAGIAAAGLAARLMIDFSHGNSAKEPEKQLDVGREVAHEVERRSCVGQLRFERLLPELPPTALLVDPWNITGAGRVRVFMNQRQGRYVEREVPAGEVWVHCRAGFRAGVAAGSLLCATASA